MEQIKYRFHVEKIRDQIKRIEAIINHPDISRKVKKNAQKHPTRL